MIDFKNELQNYPMIDWISCPRRTRTYL